MSKKSKKEYDFVGPICETSDRFLKMKKFQKLNEGEIVILKDVGASVSYTHLTLPTTPYV